MSPVAVVRRVALLMLGLTPLLMAGCLAGYVYPKVSYIPSLDIDAPPDQVSAFAVHNQREQALSLPASHTITLRPLPQQSATGRQASVSLERGYWLWGGMRISEHVSYRLTVRLYRRGYRSVEVGSWQLFEAVHWTSADTLAEREQAIDDLVAAREGEGMAWESGPSAFEHLAPGSSDPRHRQALLFAVVEYNVLATTPGIDEPTRARLHDKARQLRHHAEK